MEGSLTLPGRKQGGRKQGSRQACSAQPPMPRFCAAQLQTSQQWRATSKPPQNRHRAQYSTAQRSTSNTHLLKKEPRAVNMSVPVKLVATPSRASPAKAPGASLSAAAPAGKRYTA